MAEIIGMTKIEPRVNPIRYTRRFTKNEIVDALRLYLESNGVIVPDGICYLWGLEHKEYYRSPFRDDNDDILGDSITLAIDVHCCTKSHEVKEDEPVPDISITHDTDESTGVAKKAIAWAFFSLNKG